MTDCLAQGVKGVPSWCLSTVSACRVPLLRRMVEGGWCKLVPSLLRTTENDIREKVLLALHVMAIGCKSDFKQPDVHNSLNRLKTEWLNDASRLDVDESEYVLMLLQLVADLMSKLTWKGWIVKTKIIFTKINLQVEPVVSLTIVSPNHCDWWARSALFPSSQDLH